MAIIYFYNLKGTIGGNVEVRTPVSADGTLLRLSASAVKNLSLF